MEPQAYLTRIYSIKPKQEAPRKKRLPTRNPEPLAVLVSANLSWSMGFMCDSLFCGRRFRTLNVVDDFNREVFAIEVDSNLPAPRVIRVLERAIPGGVTLRN